jgi:localization factor PodJL
MTQDNQAALQWLEKAARQNLAPAQYRLAAMLERGVGGPKDLKRAIDLYGKAATQGHVRAMHNMGVLSAEGVEGKPDYATAATWFRKAADFGLRDSQYNLAILYARGMGVDKNLPVSWAWFTAAAAMGDADSAQKREEIAARLNPNQMAAAKAMVEAFKARTPDPAVNDVSTPPGGWDTATVTQLPKPAAPTPKAKVSKL